MSKVYGGQSFKPSLFPATKYIHSLLKAYMPDLSFNQYDYLAAFGKARDPEFDAAFAAVTSDGASCGRQLCWCLLEIPPATVLALHAHKNLEVCYILKGCMKERAIDNHPIPLDRLDHQEIDWLNGKDAQVIERSYNVGDMALYTPGSIHQIYTERTEACVMLLLYSKDCTFIRATDPAIARQLLHATADQRATYTAPIIRKPSSFSGRDPRYAKYRSGAALKPVSMTVAQVAVKALADCGVRDVILYPGAKCIELLKCVDNNSYGVRGWLCRNEHAGAFIAEGYNKSQGERLCAVMTTSGPGATNLVTGVASCWRDHIPMVVVTSQVPSYKKGTAAFQEVPVTDVFKPITKGAFDITSASQVYDTVVAACRLAVEGINGPVVVDIPEDLQAEMVTLPDPHCSRLTTVGPPSPRIQAQTQLSSALSGIPTHPLQSPNVGLLAPSALGLRSHVACPVRHSTMTSVLGYIKGAQRPLLMLGGGCQKVEEELLNELVDVLSMPVVYTFMGKGCISDDHDLCLGPVGVHGLYTANTAIQRCDLLIALGCRFDERAACKAMELWESPRDVVHVDLVAQEVMSGSPKNPITCSVVADVQDFVGALLQHLYGFIEERRRTLSVPLGNMCNNGTGDKEGEFEAFLVDEEDVRVLKDGMAKESPEKEGANGLHLCTAAAVANGHHSAEMSGSISFGFRLDEAGNGSADAPVAAAAAGNGNTADKATPFATAGSTASSIDFSGGAWNTYSEWSREMVEMKQRRWKSLMPCLSPKSELTTREMIHLLDSFLNTHGLEPIVCSDVGSHLCLLTQYLRLHHPRQWLMEGGLASMGCGMPAAVGAALANPQATCLAVAGDGGFAMTSQELMMAKVYKLNVKVIVTVNNRLQLVEQLEEENYESLDVYTFLGDPDHPHRPYPNFAKVAEAYGLSSATAWNQEELLDGLDMMFATPGPFLLEVVALAERPHIKYWDSSEQ